MNTQDPFITLAEINDAKELLEGKIVRTPLIPSLSIGKSMNIDLNYKAELYQTTGSFKLRGVLNKLSKLTDDEKAKGIVTISAGNHGKAVAHAANMMNIKATVIMPDFAPINKIESIKNYGSEVMQTESSNLMSLLNKTIEERNLTLIHPFGDLDILCGPGTLGLEILEDTNNTVNVVIVPIGGGGLISGVSASIKLSNPNVKIIGVEPTGANVMSQSLAQNKVVTVDKLDTIADGLAAPFTSDQTLAHTKKFVDKIVLVSDDEIRSAMKALILQDRIVAEPAGATGLAALLANKIDIDENQKIVCVLSGSNVDYELLKSVI
ncbi:MAG: threonine/serine dehydratase [Candidatus Heimdallarchaeota archaeon]|nr:threonine/serine dehydratase [Candidatus Heimdallarchaeota archaeon]